MDRSLWDNAVNNAVGNLGVCEKLLKTVDPKLAVEFTEKFENTVKEYCKLDIIHQSTKEALNKTKDYFANDNNDLNIPPKKIYGNFFKEMPQPDESNIENHYLQDIYHREIKILNSSENGNEQEDDDIISTNHFVPPTDPISKEPIKNPVRNVICGHIYDKHTITQMISQKKMRCPYIGCPSKQPITVNNLESDHELKRKIDSHFLNI